MINEFFDNEKNSFFLYFLKIGTAFAYTISTYKILLAVGENG